MRIVISTQKLIIGGANLNAIDIGAELVRRGHEVTVFAQRGPLVDKLAPLDLGYAEAPGDGSLTAQWPSRRSAAELQRLVARTGADVVHTYEWPACLDALMGTYLRDGTPVVASIMSMHVPRFMPKHVPVIVGTRALRDEIVRRGYARAALVEPPVDLDADGPSIDPPAARRELGLPEEGLVISIISRLGGFKLESARTAIAAMDRTERSADRCLVIAGDGIGADELRARAHEVNERAGRRAVVMLGELADPRPVYAASDVVIGMGGSALRALAFGKALVVVGAAGYSELFTPETSGEFLVQGFWGLGDGDHRPDRLEKLLDVVASPLTRRELGEFGTRFVQRFALPDAARRVEEVLESALESSQPAATRRREVASSMTRLAGVRLQGGLRRAVSARRRG